MENNEGKCFFWKTHNLWKLLQVWVEFSCPSVEKFMKVVKTALNVSIGTFRGKVRLKKVWFFFKIWGPKVKIFGFPLKFFKAVLSTPRSKFHWNLIKAKVLRKNHVFFHYISSFEQKMIGNLFGKTWRVVKNTICLSGGIIWGKTAIVETKYLVANSENELKNLAFSQRPFCRVVETAFNVSSETLRGNYSLKKETSFLMICRPRVKVLGFPLKFFQWGCQNRILSFHESFMKAGKFRKSHVFFHYFLKFDQKKPAFRLKKTSVVVKGTVFLVRRNNLGENNCFRKTNY